MVTCTMLRVVLRNIRDDARSIKTDFEKLFTKPRKQTKIQNLLTNWRSTFIMTVFLLKKIRNFP